MLSAKYVKVHGMRNEKWNTKEKILQYRTILKLHARDKKLQTVNAGILKKKVSKNLKELKTDVKKYRQIVNDVICGDKRLLRTILQNQKDFQILLQDTEPMEAFRTIFQDYNLKRKQLDKLLHQKEKKKIDFCNLKSVYTTLNDEIEGDDNNPEVETNQQYQQRQQQLLSRFQVVLAQRNAAKSINNTYYEIHTILKKDSMYFDTVLNALRNDQKDQCCVIYKTTMVGQLAAENLDDIRQRYKKMARDVWVNMKEREKSLDSMRKKVDDVWQYAKSLVRIESDAHLLKKKKKKIIDVDKKLQRQIEKLEKIFNTMKDSMLIRSYEELFVRLEDQIKQRTRLSRLYERTLKQRDSELSKEKHADLLLKNLHHSMVSTTTRYKTEKKSMQEKIKEENNRIQKNNNSVESQGELLMKIRAALQNISGMLMCIKTKPLGKVKEGRKSKEIDDVEIKNIVKEKRKDTCDDYIENEGLAALAQVTRKAAALVGLTNFQLNKEKQEKARDAYESYIADYRSKLAFGDKDLKQSGIYFEHEAVDTSVLTRADIKMRSKQIVEANAKVD